ncbi:hypothetical protein [Comamonas sp. JC664]|uniref:hypothetical protein n=1 Tax=Comamonas sp. JC664 TaxID=2801917 RepID=UPI00174A3591|nr:hypothetical protein [Comamonas sp. JC664]MBL0697803.1 hypothetical protein [Comamonas sp. JC664]GHG69661.1 hypothetical protein GCM10012319_13960 [Comamonas sp. KCTC 72670]
MHVLSVSPRPTRPAPPRRGTAAPGRTAPLTPSLPVREGTGLPLPDRFFQTESGRGVPIRV